MTRDVGRQPKKRCSYESKTMQKSVLVAFAFCCLTSCGGNTKPLSEQKTHVNNPAISVSPSPTTATIVETCQLHGEVLRPGKAMVELGYLPLMYRNAKCLKDKKTKFPYSNLWTRGEKVSKANDRGWAGVLYCAKCREEERKCVKDGAVETFIQMRKDRIQSEKNSPKYK